MVLGRRGDRVRIVPKIRHLRGCGKPVARLIPLNFRFELFILGVDTERERCWWVIY